MLCGISTSFPVLFRTHRQVAHALLTRPPLIIPRRVITVRLECVMHAASVHPEPGSNSLIIVYSLRSPSVNIVSQSNSICSITFSSFSFILQKNFGVSYTSIFIDYFMMLVVQFSMSFLRFCTAFQHRFPRQLVYYITFFPFCQHLFLSFLRFFAVWSLR